MYLLFIISSLDTRSNITFIYIKKSCNISSGSEVISLTALTICSLLPKSLTCTLVYNSTVPNSSFYIGFFLIPIL